MEELKHVTIFTDGGSLGNPGPGGYAAIVEYKDRRRELSQGYRLTTNNRMELMAAITGLSALKERCKVTLYTDSQYLVNGIMKGWAKRWQSKGWMRNKTEKAENVDLWEKLLGLIAYHEVEFKWVRGHAGHTENEMCDQLCKQAAQAPNLLEDTGYRRA
ncbi:MAG: ribonuclease HI [Ignavibacteria bacterium]|jgi:ribonuclease HI|nr:ribonuclease HI [Ignavibacteria bacterium]MCU7503937.1 ribonuclease HI [Ignavibacteria bacterium]MCU7515842.1 ribonuclease HI [Ignavibacteria bacterium]